MNQKRKAELQRKLSMTSVPRPPAGLSERLKADIPANLMSVERERARFSRSTTFSMSVAASILLLIGSAYIALQVLSRSKTEIASAPPSMVSRRQAPAAPQAEVTITLAENDKDVNTGSVAEVDTVARRDENEPVAAFDARKKLAKETAVVAAAEEKQEAGNQATPPAPKPQLQIAAAPALAPPPPAAEAASAGAAAPQSMTADAGTVSRSAAKTAARNEARSVTVTTAAPTIIETAHAADLSFAPAREVFGLSVDPSAFERVKHDIERGERPAAGSVDVAALINYFSGTARAPRRDVRLDVEASRAPLAPDTTALLRFTIDTPHEEVAARGSIPPFATDADLEINLNSSAVLTHRLIGADELKSQSTLLKNVSVTGLMDLRLKPGVNPRTTIATLTLKYRLVSDGKYRTVTRAVHAADVNRSWSSSTRRHRLATLGAVWSESLAGGPDASDVARTAEKLATEEPADSRAKDLAAVASASSRLQSSGPTGSGR